MNTWQHGYYADGGYTYGQYPETQPVRLRWAAMLRGHITPERKFRYLDAGCGQGVGLIIAAAMHPDSEFVGIDFMPEHIAHGRRLAERMGVTNVQFIEGDFIELSENHTVLGDFDFAVAHGISTWIAPAVKAGLFSLVSRCLKPGGIFYNSYNTYPGWLSTTPLQHLVLLNQRRLPGAEAITAAQRQLEILKANGPAMSAALPGLQPRLESMKGKDPAYLVQEYNNQHWAPVFVSQMITELQGEKLQFLGTATLPDAFQAMLKPEMRAALAQEADPILREQLSDFAINQSFRRDLYVKGLNRIWRTEQQEMAGAQRFIANPLVTKPEAGKPYIIRGGSVEISGLYDAFTPVLNAVESRPEGISQAEITALLPPELQVSAISTLCYLTHGQWVMPQSSPQQVEAAREGALRAATALAQAASQGAPYNALPTPQGGTVTLGSTDMLMYALVARHGRAAPLADLLQENLKALALTLTKEGKSLTEPAEQRTQAEVLVQQYLAKTHPALQLLGVAAV